MTFWDFCHAHMGLTWTVVVMAFMFTPVIAYLVPVEIAGIWHNVRRNDAILKAQKGSDKP